MTARFIRALLLLFVIAVPAFASPARAEFVAGFEDLPLMGGLAPVGTGNLSFDSPEGRIVIAYAEGRAGRPEVLQFYATALTQLGWERLADAIWMRDREMLRLEFGEKPPVTTVRFTLSPVR